jgi:type II secretory ATPase GspE/PulE/Tfp pilus assembly ATPase PilB-like protein/predicted aspartyl protease
MQNKEFIIPSLNGDEVYPADEARLPILVEGWNDKIIDGFLMDFQPSKEQLKIMPVGLDKSIVVRFNQIKRLRLSRTVDGRGRVPPTLHAEEVLRPFAVQLRDGSVYSGLCYGYRKVSHGLWIFPRVVDEKDPDRVFIADTGIKSFEIHSSEVKEDLQPELTAKLLTADEEMTPQSIKKVVASIVTNRQQLEAALERQTKLKPIPIGEALLGLGKITPEQLIQALERQRTQRDRPLGQTLIDMGLIQPADLQIALARKMGYPFVDVRRYPIDGAALKLVPMNLAARLEVLPIDLVGAGVVVAMPDPLQFKVIDELEFTAQCKIIPVVSPIADLRVKIVEAYRAHGLADDGVTLIGEEASGSGITGSADQSASQLAEELTDESLSENFDERALEQSDNTLVKLVNSMIIEAFHQRASDIHIEPYPGRDKVVIRFRVDGEMRPYLELPPNYRNALVARIKIMCNLDISERRKPQDGKIQFKRFGGLPIELRVATIPTAGGVEDVVMRILNSSAPLPLDGLHLSVRNLAAIEQILTRPYGLFLCVGPTGSGKTTTLHAALQRLNTPNRKIWTAEDPVEITQRGLRQIQINPKIGWTFASALRSLLRADPDVIMVGEIRDAETADMAIEASLTGHFVMSTLHTNSAAETILRLHDLGVDPFSFADSLQGILAQRLVRRLCPACVEIEPITSQRLRELIHDYRAQLPPDHPLHDDEALNHEWRQRFSRDGQLVIGHAPGCVECGQTGFRGRVALHELLVASPDIRQLVQTRARPAEIQAQAVREGMRTLRQDGIEKVLAGLTTLAEVRANSNV